MLLLRDGNGRILLERRPPTGVWARLWSLPETASVDDAAPYARTLGVDAQRFESLPHFVHTFSHYHLAVQPLLAPAAPRMHMSDAPDLRWASRGELADIGLPAPVRKLLSTLTD
jgi:A/G-specific adenine glycosylase